MKQNNGKLIVIDGLDGCGKTTQFAILREKLVNCKAISFPDYDNPSSALVKMYLDGDISKKVEDINAYAAASFYAVDRYASYKMFWEQDYKQGATILASRYVSSNAIHQMGKLPEIAWDAYLTWLVDYEYVKLGLPVPDLVVFLDMNPEMARKLLLERYNGDETKMDIHEVDIEYLRTCRKAALYAAEKLGWQVVVCGTADVVRSIGSINADIMARINMVFRN